MIREYAKLHNGSFKIFYTTLNVDEKIDREKRPVQLTYPICILTLQAQKKKTMPMMFNDMMNNNINDQQKQWNGKMTNNKNIVYCLSVSYPNTLMQCSQFIIYSDMRFFKL